MPKKTKKEKILADNRKEKTVSNGQLYEFVKPLPSPRQKLDTTNTTSGYAFQKEIVPVTKNVTHAHSYTYVYHDLIRITIFTILAIATQGVLYFLLRR